MSCHEAGVRGMWPSVATSVCEVMWRDDDLSPSDRSTAGWHHVSSVCAAELPHLPDL